MIKKYPVEAKSRRGIIVIRGSEIQKLFTMSSIEPDDIVIIKEQPGRVVRKDDQAVYIDTPNEIEIEEFRRIMEFYEKITNALDEERIGPSLISLFLGLLT